MHDELLVIFSCDPFFSALAARSQDPDEIVREKVEIPLPEVSQEEVEAAAARLSHVSWQDV